MAADLAELASYIWPDAGQNRRATGAVGVDQLSSLRRGLVYSNRLGADDVDIVGGRKSTPTAVSRVPHPKGGTASNFVSANSSGIVLPTTDMVSGYPLTVSCWADMTDSGGGEVLFSLNGTGWSAIAGNTNAGQDFLLNEDCTTSSLVIQPVSGLHHLIIAFLGGGVAKVYLEGVFTPRTRSAGNTGWGRPAAGNNAIGYRLNGASPRYNNGLISDFNVWKRELSAQEALLLYQNAGQPYSAPAVGSAMVFAGGGGGGAFNATYTDNAAATDAQSTALAAAAAITEAAAATSAQSAALAATAALTENASATTTQSITVGFAASISEIAAALESISAVAAMTATIIENASASSAEAAAMSASATYTDNAAATDAQSAAAAVSASLTENAAATDTVAVAAAGAYLATITETANGSDTASTSVTMAASITETAAATSSQAGVAGFSSALTENATASSTQSAAAAFVASIVENATASDTQAVAAAFVAALVENATASDSYVVFNAYMASIIEQANATDSLLAVWYDASDDTAYPLVGLVQSYPGDGYAQHYPLEGLTQS